ncbi:MAG: hypothetical protein K6C34_00220 [Alphaproteobacteria bacterium]|nr:hypothetical protein [Alphaproteobacteria bacterium]
MSFFSSAVKLIRGKKNFSEDSSVQNNNPVVTEEPLEKNFSLRDYAKESFSVLIVKPLSSCMMKIIRVTSLGVTGVIIGLIVALLSIGIFLQFGSVENTVVSSIVLSQFEKFFPDTDLSMKSAMLRWNPEEKALEIDMRKVRLDDLAFPRVSILPDYTQSFKQHRFVTKSVSIVNPKIDLEINDKSISFNPNLEKGGRIKELFVPLSSTNILKGVFDKNVVVKLINADAFVKENGADWTLKKIYCEHVIGEKYPRAFDCSAVLPGQKYTSNFSIKRNYVGADANYDVKINEVNPTVVMNAFSKRNTPLDRRIISVFEGYNLPISGNIGLKFNEESKFLGGKFDLYASSGSIRLPVKSSLSLNLGKKIDNGSISGSFTEDHAKIDSINISYGDSGLQLTGIDVPMSMFKFLDVANVNGTLSLTNIDIKEMETILPKNIAKSVVPTFENYLPGFKLELFKIDVKGPVIFGERANEEQIEIGQGIFKIKDAKIPLGEHVITNVNATANIVDDGFDIRLISANCGKTKINSGAFFLSNKDGSWMGNVNASVPIDEIPEYVTRISNKLSSLPLNKLGIKGVANLDMKLVRVEGDTLENKELPFRIVEGDGVLKTPDNTRSLKFSWGEKSWYLSSDVECGSYKINFRMEEDLEKKVGLGTAMFESHSSFLKALVPFIQNVCEGDFKLKVDTNWTTDKQEFDVALDLKNASFILPMLGDIKSRKDNGMFTAHVVKDSQEYNVTGMKLETAGNKIHGNMLLDSKGTILKTSLDTFNVKGCNAKINLLREANNLVLISAIGDSFNAENMVATLEKLEPNLTVSTYVDLKELMLSDCHKIKNAKGNFDVRNGKLVGGACYGIIGDSTTVALSVKDTDGGKDNLISLSASNAGEFLKFMQLTDGIEGGTLNIASVSSKNSSSSLSGDFEIRDFIVRNNPQFTKLVSLSTTNLLSGSDDITAGFNICAGNFIANGEKIIINGRAVGPTICLSFSGTYNRVDDELKVFGYSLPVSAIIRAQNNGALTAVYHLSGSLGAPQLSVEPLKFIDLDALYSIFGNLLPMIPGTNLQTMGETTTTVEEDPSSPIPSVRKGKEFDNKSFDRALQTTEGNASMISEKNTNTVKKTINTKSGVTIIRGVSKN